ncbi:MAG: sugar ABC transporter permease [Propionibacteriaceae bacterium]|jgi:N,N'-diacetylchitobiose transport system permease protein|nr:sugar ABC transporter permease [Propionibacteriaceae bacterium]
MSVVTTIDAETGVTAREVNPRKRKIAPYLLIAPAIVMLVVAMGYPLGWQIYTSVHHYGLAQQFGKAAEFVGVDNFTTLFSSSTTWMVVIRSLVFCLVNAGLTLLIGLGAALLMKAVHKAVRLTIQIAMLLAWATPVTAAVTIWIWLFDWHHGVINWVLSHFWPSMVHFNWLGTPLGFYSVATLIVVWMSVPFVAFSIYAGLTQVPDEVMEAAQIDGATAWQRLTKITLPLIRPVLMIVALLQLIWDLRVFTQTRMLQDYQDPLNVDLLGTYIYRMGIGQSDFSMASAFSIFVLLLTIAVSWFYVRELIKEDN